MSIIGSPLRTCAPRDRRTVKIAVQPQILAHKFPKPPQNDAHDACRGLPDKGFKNPSVPVSAASASHTALSHLLSPQHGRPTLPNAASIRYFLDTCSGCPDCSSSFLRMPMSKNRGIGLTVRLMFRRPSEFCHDKLYARNRCDYAPLFHFLSLFLPCGTFFLR